MHSVPPRRAHDDINLANCVTLAILCEDVDAATLFFCDCTQASVDDDVKAVTDVVRTPQDLPGVDLNPIERTVNVENCPASSAKPSRPATRNRLTKRR